MRYSMWRYEGNNSKKDLFSSNYLNFSKPRLIVSRCFFEHTRYDGGIISSNLIKALEKYCEFEKVCPEVEIGLPIPREPIDVFLIDGEYKLMNKSQTVNLTD
ncbi:MAG: 2-thiouracil desulfurase family protein, partial [Fervidobacterium sp.]